MKQNWAPASGSDGDAKYFVSDQQQERALEREGEGMRERERASVNDEYYLLIFLSAAIAKKKKKKK